jgi:hypothetical protein
MKKAQATKATTTTTSTKSTFKTLGYKLTNNALVISYANENGERKKSYAYNCPEENREAYAKHLEKLLATSNTDYIMNEAKKLTEKGFLINLKELRDEQEDFLSSLQ